MNPYFTPTYTSNLMTKIFRIISTLDKVNVDSPPPGLIFNHLVYNFHNIHFPILLSILFSNSDFSSVGGSKKGVYETKWENNFGYGV